jgi:hypothetical protein
MSLSVTSLPKETRRTFHYFFLGKTVKTSDNTDLELLRLPVCHCRLCQV